MAIERRVHPNYVAVWGWLVGLLIIGTASTLFPLPRAASLVVIFGAAVAKALLVAANFMHLRFEPRLIYAIAIAPLILFLGLMLALVPDIVMGR
jgi:caa(3)-type oxidase subunit IV